MTEPQATTFASESADSHVEYVIRVSRVRWLVGMRWLGIFAMAALGGLLLWFGRRPEAASTLVLLTAGAMLLHNIVAMVLLPALGGRTGRPTSHSLAVVAATILTMDMFAWIFVMHFTGGVISPLAVVPVFIAGVSATLLPVRWVKRLIVAAGIAIIVTAMWENEIGFYCAGGTLFSGVLADRWDYGNRTFLVGVFAGGICLVMILSAYLTDAILARLRRINLRLVMANRELSALDATKSRFLRVSSHQLRGPVSAIHTLVNAIQQVGALSPKQYDLMRKLHARCDDIIKQLDEMQLLGTIKDETGKTRELHPVELGGLLAETARLFDEEATNNEVKITVAAAGNIYVPAWDNSLNVVFANIIGNAVKYTPPGGSVAVTAARSGERVEVKVADTGIGIPPEQQEQVFREFFRGTNARQVCGGTGMGLSIVKEIVDELGGGVSLSSELGKGTTVTVTLPAAEKNKT